MDYPCRRLARLGLPALLLVSTGALAQIRFVDASVQALPLAAGNGSALVFQLRNSGAAGATIQLAASGLNQAGGYTLASAGDCPLPAQFATVGLTLAAGETRECRFQLQRSGKSTADTRIVFGLQENGDTVQQKQFRAGDLARLEWTQQLERPPATGVPARVRVTVRNAGPSAVGSLSYGSCLYFLPPSSIPQVVGGDCSPGGGAVICFTGGIGAGFDLSGLAAGASRSCLLEWQPAGADPIVLALQGLNRQVGSGQLENSNPAADSIALQILQPSIVQQLPGLRWPGVFLAAGGMLLLAARRQRVPQ